ncbi:alpha/beta fold hydrolase [Nocardia nova]|uniref:alpha/beta fold hydrolase n=1 Tax=Nocardia nova TaxID=37330 RepID=UPI0033E22479
MDLVSDVHPMTITSGDGLALTGVRRGTGLAAATVVYVHGLLSDASYWEPVTACLHDRLGGEIAQIVYDQRGHGNSDRPHRSAETTLEDLADDLDVVLAQATGSVVLVTHSAGSLVAAAYVRRYPARAAALSGLILFNGTGEFPEFPALPRQFRAIATRLKNLRHSRFDHLAAVCAVVAEQRFRRTARRLGSRAPLVAGARAGDPRVLTDVMAAYREFHLDADIAARMRSLPSFVVTGDRDRVVPAEQSMRLAAKIWADFQIVSGVGHSLPHSNPDTAADVIVAALDIAYRSDLRELLIERDDDTGDRDWVTETDGAP